MDSSYDEETLKQFPVLTLSEDGTQLRLGDTGKTIGHRDMKVYVVSFDVNLLFVQLFIVV